MVILPGLSIKSVMLSAPAVAKEYEIMQEVFTVYVFDRRSDLPDCYTVADMARDTVLAMTALGLHDIDLFGASQGGMIAMEIAVEHPGLVHKLVLASTAASVQEDGFGTLGKWLKLAEKGDRVGLFLAFGEALYPTEVFRQYRDALVMIANSVTDDELRRFVILAEGARGFDILDRLDKICCPVLVIGSDDDRVLEADAFVQIVERLDGREDFQSHLYHGYGHAAFDTAPDCRERIYRFFTL